MIIIKKRGEIDMVDLKVAVIGIGNCGSNIAHEAKEKFGIMGAAINTCKDDLSFHVGVIPTFLIGDGGGVGRDRTTAKYYLRQTINELLNNEELLAIVEEADIIFVPSSCAGGTGSGTSLLFAQILTSKLRDDTDKKVIPIGVAPVNSESLGSQLNFTDYMDDLLKSIDYIDGYMLYDNQKCDDHMNQDIVIRNVNKRIVDDIVTISGAQIHKSNGRSIDTQSMHTILRAKGRIVVARAEGFKDSNIKDAKDIEELLIRDLQTSPHVTIDRSQFVQEYGLIANLNANIYPYFNINVPTVCEYLGRPTDTFENILENDSQMMQNEVYLIASGLTFPSTRLLEANEILRAYDEEERQRKARLENIALNLDDLFNNECIKNIRSNRSSYQSSLSFRKKEPKQRRTLDDIFDIED